MSGKAVCPSCGADAPAPGANPYFPFCCKRCKLVDLGAWADGRYRIAAADDAANDAADDAGAPDGEGGDGSRS